MKILFYNHTGKVAGAESVLLMIVARLDRERFDPIVVCPEQGPLLQLVTELGVPVETVASLDARFTRRIDQLVRYFKSFLLVIRQLRRKVINNKPNLIHANSIRAGLVATAATFGLGTRVVWHLHDVLPRHPLSIGIRAFAFFCPRIRMIAVSQAAADGFSGMMFSLRDRTTVILNAVDLRKFSPDQAARRRLRAELSLVEDEFAIGIVGRLTPNKGQVELLRAFARVLPEIPNAKLLLVGTPLFNRDEEYQELLEQTAAGLGISEHVLMLGQRDDVAAVMQALDLLVINSTVEAFCLVALEAMAVGIPILATIAGGIPELIEHGKNGWLMPRRDEGLLAAAILHLSRQPALCAQLAAQGSKHMDSRFCVDRYVAELQTFYHSSRLPARSRKDATAERVGDAGFA
jgi:glycosyltransferase involved in cell wall biosynthesis